MEGSSVQHPTASVAFDSSQRYIGEQEGTTSSSSAPGARTDHGMATPQLLLPALARAFSLSESSDPDDPEYMDALREIREIHKGAGWVVVQVRSHGFSLGDDLVWDLPGELARFREVLEAAGIRELRFQELLPSDLLADFFSRLSPGYGPPESLPSSRFRGLEDHIGFSFRQSDSPLPGMSGRIQDLFRTRTSPAVHGSKASEPAATRAEGEPAVPKVEESAGAESLAEPKRLPRELAEEVETYFASSAHLKRESEQRLRAGAAGLAEARNLNALGDLIGLLVQSGNTEVSDEAGIELARDLVTPALASYLVAKLGAAREEEIRGRLTRIVGRIGREGALALSDALGEARDRSERRIFLGALMTLGPLAAEMARRMVEDPRWFVVRNGVAVLGQVGGDEAGELLTETLTNEDARVRVASILALVKVGSIRAEPLLLGMLDDPAPEVRAVACRGLGVLRSESGLRALEYLLKDEAVDVQIESLRALGQIGNPRSVPLIERKAFGRFFSKPPREVRIAAFRALGAIGTARCLDSLNKGARDRDKEVREAVKPILSEF